MASSHPSQSSPFRQQYPGRTQSGVFSSKLTATLSALVLPFAVSTAFYSATEYIDRTVTHHATEHIDHTFRSQGHVQHSHWFHAQLSGSPRAGDRSRRGRRCRRGGGIWAPFPFVGPPPRAAIAISATPTGAARPGAQPRGSVDRGAGVLGRGCAVGPARRRGTPSARVRSHQPHRVEDGAAACEVWLQRRAAGVVRLPGRREGGPRWAGEAAGECERVASWRCAGGLMQV